LNSFNLPPPLLVSASPHLPSHHQRSSIKLLRRLSFIKAPFAARCVHSLKISLSMAPKRKHKEEGGEEHSNEENFEEDDYEEATKPKKVSKPRAKKEKKPLLQEPFTDEQGWHTEPPSLIWK
jgi:hypothetical protein